jgi:phosphoribosylamine--glycine ligase
MAGGLKVLVVGSGGREHALCWAIASSPLCDRLWCVPGNAGIARDATCVPVAAEDIDGILAFALAEAVDFVVVGPETPLVAGLVDRLEAAGIKAFGPTAAAAALEGSKGFMKDFCARNAIPTADYARFTEAAAAHAHAEAAPLPMVIKADGLAAGKGVTIARTRAEAHEAIDQAMVEGRFGAAGAEVVIEAFLDGEEVSFFALVDGADVLPLGSAQDHKRVGDGDTGPNTGGMGAYSPAPVLTPALEARVMREIVAPTARAMVAEARPFRGVLFAGLMIVATPDGPAPRLIEYNVRFGDPECQVLMMRLMSDVLPVLLAVRDGQLRHIQLRWYADVAICVVMAAHGYPGTPARGSEIGGLDAAGAIPEVKIFHAGTRSAPDGRVLADGGRVLGITAIAPTVAEARDLAYRSVDCLSWPEGFCRRDIGWRAIG